MMVETFPHCRNSGPGFSVFRGILILWDCGYDARLLDILERMPNDQAAKLLVIKASNYL